MRLTLAMASLLVGSTLLGGVQSPIEAKLLAQLKQLFPGASMFSPKEGSPPHFKAYKSDTSGARTLLGLAFWTTELEPLERAYDGPIKILVGMDPTGILNGIVVVDHREPYGYFSIDLAAFAAQFVGKDIRDPFRVGVDIDAVSRASISITSASRAVRNGGRRVVRELLTPPAVAK
jgi:NosR/NirI family nitrous oxide reductase transcriptional regulator